MGKFKMKYLHSRFAFTFSFFLIFFAPFNLYAWNALGHMVIADIAYQYLTPDVKTKVNDLALYLNKEYSYIKNLEGMAAWPDAIRSQKIEAFTHWHYVDTAFSGDGTPVKNITDADNALWALSNVTVIVQNNRANVYERARFLAFLVHIVADLHQPLHTSSRITAEHPDGDRGGNSYYLKSANLRAKTMNLHRYWDEGGGVLDAEATSANANAIADELTAAYPRNYFADKVNDIKPQDWADEGLNLSQTFLYTTPENEYPSNRYIEKSQEISKQRVALAGYRLAKLLNSLLS
jgi:hypothetical protein